MRHAETVEWMTNPKDEYTWKEVKDLTGCDDALLRRFASEGHLRVFKRGGRNYVLRAHLEHFMIVGEVSQWPEGAVVEAILETNKRISLEPSTVMALLLASPSIIERHWRTGEASFRLGGGRFETKESGDPRKTQVN